MALRAVAIVALVVGLAAAAYALATAGDGTRGTGRADPPPTPTGRGTVAAPTQPGHAISGRVIDALGEPVPRVEVQVLADSGSWHLQPPADEVRATTETDEAGRFRILQAGLDTPSAVLLRHRYYVPRVIARYLPTGASHALGTWTLRTGTGVVIAVHAAETGQPLPGADIRIVRARPAADLAARAARATAATDSRGEATLFGVAPGTWTVRVTAPGRQTLELEHVQPDRAPRAPRVEIQLQPGRTLAGRVVDATATPIRAATVTCFQDVPGALRHTASTDEEGGFRSDGLGAGPYVVVVHAPDGRRARIPDVDPTAGYLEVPLPAGTELIGTVLDARDRRPLVGATVQLERASGWPVAPGDAGTAVRTDATGTFRFRGITPGIGRLVATSQGFSPRILPSLQLGSTPSQRLDPLLMEPGCTVTGKVAGPLGTPLEHAMIEAVPFSDDATAPGLSRLAATGVLRGPAPRTWARSGVGGRFRLAGLRPGSYRLVVRAPGLAPTCGAPFEATAGATRDRGAIRLKRGGTIEGQTLDNAGNPAAGATVYLTPTKDPDGARLGAMGRSDASGRFRLAAVAAGSYRMFYDYPERDTARAAAASRAATRVEIQVEDQQVRRQDLRPRAR